MTMHTPTPWEARNVNKTVYSAVYVTGTQFAVASGCQREDAEFIVRACNSHDELLDACKNLLANPTRESRIEARSAIQKAGG